MMEKVKVYRDLIREIGGFIKERSRLGCVNAEGFIA